MTKINDQVLAQIGLELRNDKIPPTAVLLDSIQPTIETEPFRRRMVSAEFTAASLTGAPGSFEVSYDSPEGHAIRWYGVSCLNKNVPIICQVQGTDVSPSGIAAVVWSTVKVDTDESRLLIGDQQSRHQRQIDFTSSTVLVPASRRLTIFVAPEAGSFTAALKILIHLVGFTEPMPRTRGEADNLKLAVAVVQP